MKQGLFRQQALKHQGERLQGELILSQPVSYSLLSMLLVAIAVVALIFLLLNDYTSKQTVSGILIPDKGFINISNEQAGILIESKVQLHAMVLQGEELFRLQLDHGLKGPESVTTRLLANLSGQFRALEQDIVLARRQKSAIQENLAAVRAGSMQQQMELESVKRTQHALLNIKKTAMERAENLRSKGLLSSSDTDRVFEEYLSQQGNVEQINLQIIQSQNQSEELIASKKQQLVEADQALNSLEHNLAELNRQQIQLKSEQFVSILAPVDGYIDSINVNAGQLLEPGVVVATLIPADTVLKAELMLPDRAIGFIATGQTVKIRYAAFPYQKFGVQKAVIDSISDGPVAFQQNKGNDPLYKVQAHLASQQIQAYGKGVVLRPGMLLEADIVTDNRSLLEWLLEPLFSIKGKL